MTSVLFDRTMLTYIALIFIVNLVLIFLFRNKYSPKREGLLIASSAFTLPISMLCYITTSFFPEAIGYFYVAGPLFLSLIAFTGVVSSYLLFKNKHKIFILFAPINFILSLIHPIKLLELALIISVQYLNG